VAVQVAFFLEPPAGAGPKVFEIGKLAAAQKIPLHLLKRAFDLSLRFRPRPLTGWAKGT
jgi:hypothetical protein